MHGHERGPYLSDTRRGVIISGLESAHIWIKLLRPLPSDAQADRLLNGGGERDKDAFIGEPQVESVLKVGMTVRFTVARERTCVYYELSVDALGRFRL